uniref:Helicase C-terminal domain-containing protein n=1 Tax=Panagrolaimus sp. PS1159 TaxID=55785 RepID=A0AC35GMQ4_9BILA
MNCMQEFYFVNEDQKPDALIKYLQKTKDEQGKYPKTAVFCSNHVSALKLTFALISSYINALPTSKSAINQFNNDEVHVLFITDVCEELLDINYEKCDVLINYDIP